MQKVVGSSPIIRFETTCKLTGGVASAGNSGCRMAAHAAASTPTRLPALTSHVESDPQHGDVLQVKGSAPQWWAELRVNWSVPGSFYRSVQKVMSRVVEQHRALGREPPCSAGRWRYARTAWGQLSGSDGTRTRDLRRERPDPPFRGRPSRSRRGFAARAEPLSCFLRGLPDASEAADAGATRRMQRSVASLQPDRNRWDRSCPRWTATTSSSRSSRASGTGSLTMRWKGTASQGSRRPTSTTVACARSPYAPGR
jgi:hypothetical protein